MLVFPKNAEKNASIIEKGLPSNDSEYMKMHRYRRGHGFESRSSLNFFQA